MSRRPPRRPLRRCRRTATARPASRASRSCGCSASSSPLGVARRRLDRLRDDDGGRQPTCRASTSRPAAAPRAQLGHLRRPRQQARDPRPPTRTGSSSPTRTSRRSMQLRRHRDRGQALLQQLRRRPARHRARLRARTWSSSAARRAAPRSPSSSSRTRCRRRATAPSSRSCARPRSPTTSTRKWSKEKILTEYLNTIYFGNGAYGVESAARTYFGKRPQPRGLRRRASTAPCAKELQPWEAALLAGIIASPSALRPGRAPGRREAAPRPRAARTCSSRAASPAQQYDDAIVSSRCGRGELDAARGSARARRTSPRWVRQQLIDRFGPREGVRGRPEDQDHARPRPAERGRRHAIDRYLSYPGGPTASLVAIDNKTGEVRAMVGGRDYATVAVQPRDPGPAPAGLVVQAVHPRRGAASEGVERQLDLWPSRKRDFIVPGTKGKEHFVVNNFEGTYAGRDRSRRR